MSRVLSTKRNERIGGKGRSPASSTTYRKPSTTLIGPPRLPVELTDRIIDFCHDNKKTLSNCSLTHSSWLPASRFHLFRSITLFGGQDGATQFEFITPKKPSTLSRRWSILPYIRIVKIESFSTYRRAAQLESIAYLAHEIRRIRSIQHLSTPSVHVSLGQYLPGPGDALSSSLSLASDIVTHVKLLNAIFAHQNDVWPLISSFRRLRCLELSNVRFKYYMEGDLPAESLLRGVPLSTLRITTRVARFIISSLVRMADSMPHLDDFGVGYQHATQEALSGLAETIQRRVKCLRFSASCYSEDESGTLPPAPLTRSLPPHMGYGARGPESRPHASNFRIPELVGKFCSLDTLVLDNLRVDGSDGHPISSVSFGWIPAVLERLSSPIRRLAFEVTATSYQQIDAIPWGYIDKIVDPENQIFKQLAHVEVLVRQGVHCRGIPPLPLAGDIVRSEIARRLPTITLLGLLRCKTTGC